MAGRQRSAHYAPTTSDIFALGNYLAPTLLDGDAGTDTLNISNKATAQLFEGTGRLAGTKIIMTDPDQRPDPVRR